jgi:hypothetical protein
MIWSLVQLWQLDERRVLREDPTDHSSYAKLMAGQKATLAFADPPHNVHIDGHATGLGKTRHAEFPMASGEIEFTELLTICPAGFAGASIAWHGNSR